jgi:arylsulfatase
MNKQFYYVFSQHADIVTKLLSVADKARADLGDNLTKTQGQNTKPAGRLKSVQ